MNELKINENIKIEDMIYKIRGQYVMLDSDLAKLYGVETKRINEAVKNNPYKFPERFAFRISEIEYNSLKSKFSTSKGGSRKGHTVFTEQGTAMLATILKSKIATQVSINIMDAFVAMRKYIKYSNSNYNKRLSNIETKIIEHDNKFEEIFDKLEPTINNHIFFEGSIYDAYSLLIDILNTSKEHIIIIDNYIDKKLLDICSKIKSNITIYTNKINQIDLEKYNKQYKNIDIKIVKSFHDRFIIIDNKKLYHCGASFKDLGNKCFSINKIDNENILNNLLTSINNNLKNHINNGDINE